jgi:hypothetical protein
MNPPAWFIREMSAFDEDLRLRWSVKLEMWQIERRVKRSMHPGTIKCGEIDDDRIRARDGYLLVASVPPRGLCREIFQKLKDADLWARGGWKEVANAIEAAEELEEEQRWKAFSDDIKAYSADIYEWLKIRDGRTVYNAGFLE